MAKQPSPFKEFLAQVRKAVGAFFVGAIGTAATAISAVYTATGVIDKLDPYALTLASIAAGLVAAFPVYKLANKPAPISWTAPVEAALPEFPDPAPVSPDVRDEYVYQTPEF